MNLTDEKIKEILLKGNYVSDKDMQKAQDFADREHSSVVNYLLTQGLINGDLLGQAMAEHFRVPYADLNSNHPVKDQVLRLPESLAREYRAILFREDKNEVVVTTDNPERTSLLKELEKIFAGKKISLAYSLPQDITETLVNYRKNLESRLAKILKKGDSVAPEIINEIIDDSLVLNASDIHLEPQGETVMIRFRVDGVLHEAGTIEIVHYENILNRVKVQAHMRTDEHFSAQDGAIRYEKEEVTVDIRVSVVPTVDGEKVVMRVLSKYVQNFTLSNLGLVERDEKIIDENSKKPFGMILVVGPTGSGKTTTLYSLIKKINHPEVNISTIEDPVEYKIKGINQIQVNHQTNLTFTEGLRSIVRQDPDIILVGEIRDSETTEIAVNAALTGHLMLSTFHANDAATAIPRLLDMGIEPFLLASTIELIIAQRLLRKICENCRYSYTERISELRSIFPTADKYFSGSQVTLYKGKGCASCNHTGYRGRIAIFELINVTPELKDLTLKSPSSKQIWELARSQGSQTLFQDGIEKVKSGITNLPELLRVAAPGK